MNELLAMRVNELRPGDDVVLKLERMYLVLSIDSRSSNSTDANSYSIMLYCLLCDPRKGDILTDAFDSFHAHPT